MKFDTNRRRAAPLLTAALLAATAILGAGCNSAGERDAERAGERTREDVRDFRDFLHTRGITIDTRLPDR